MKYLIFIFAISLAACSNKNGNAVSEAKAEMVVNQKDLGDLSVATFAGGCFWCTEAIFERTKGVKEVVSGYTAGETENPTYEQVGRGITGHTEAIQIYYDSTIITYPKLFEIFMATHDPTQLNRQGPDVGTQYRSGAYYRTEEEKAAIEAHIKILKEEEKYNRPIVTEVEAFDTFYIAEDYHQNYYELHPENPYIQRISRPKVEKFKKLYAKDWLKEAYMK
ncbi:MAG: peptide-methionine (S)-S-oxide reductase MsrA [Bacteroidota bacterium]